jgi:hypothetical protein
LVFGCQKETNLSEVNQIETTENNSTNTFANANSENEFALTVENFFNPIYVRDYLKMPSKRIVVSDGIVNLMEEIFTSNYNNIIINQIGNFYGMPCWSCSEHDPNFDNFSMTPIYDLHRNTLTAIIIAKHDESPINMEIIDRNVLNKFFDSGNPRHLYIQGVFSFFDLKINRGDTNQATQRGGVCQPNSGTGWCYCSDASGYCGTSGAPPCTSGCGQIYEPGGYQGDDWGPVPFRAQIKDANGLYFTAAPSNIFPPAPTWNDIGASWGINLNAFDDVLNPNDTSFPPLEGNGIPGNNTTITDDVPTFNLQQAIQLLQIQVISFINHYNLDYTPEEMEQIVTLQACGVLSVSDFFLCASYQLINDILTIHTQLDLNDAERIYLWENFELFPIIQNLIDEEGIDYASDITKAYIQIALSPNSNMSWNDVITTYDFLKTLEPDLTGNQFDWYLENLPFLKGITDLQNSNLTEEEKTVAIYNHIVDNNFDPLALEIGGEHSTNESSGLWDWEEFTRARVWEIANPYKNQLIQEFPNKIQVINDLFPARVLGQAFEETCLEALSIPHYNIVPPSSFGHTYTKRPDGFFYRPVYDGFDVFQQPCIVEIKMVANTSPSYTFGITEQLEEFILYLNNETYKRDESLLGGLLLILPAGVPVDDIIGATAAASNVPFLISRVETDSDNPQQLYVDFPECVNFHLLNYDGLLFKFLGDTVLKYSLERNFEDGEFEKDEALWDLQKHTEIFIQSHLD